MYYLPLKNIHESNKSAEKTYLWEIVWHLRLDSVGRSPRLSKRLHRTLEVHFANSRHQHAENSLNMCSSRVGQRETTRVSRPAGGALLPFGPAQRTARAAKNRYLASLPVSALFFLSCCFNEFLFSKPGPRLGGLRLFTLVIHGSLAANLLLDPIALLSWLD